MLVNNWNNISESFDINVHITDFRPLNVSDDVQVANTQTHNRQHQTPHGANCLSRLARALIVGITHGLLQDRDCGWECWVSTKPTTPRILAQGQMVEVTSPVDAHVEVYTRQGALVAQGNVSKEQPASLPVKQGNGLYLVLVKSASGTQTAQKVYIMD